MNIPTKAMSCSMPLRLMIHYCFRDDFSHRRSGCQTVADKKSSNVHSQLVTTDMNTRKVLKRNKAKLNVHFANSLCKEYFSYNLDLKLLDASCSA